MGAKQRAFIIDAARALDKAKMMRYDEKSGNFYCTELGRIASHFYLQYSSVETYNEMLRRHMSESEVGSWFFLFCVFSFVHIVMPVKFTDLSGYYLR
jgi:replicative superfamily II helicase